ncbi:MAG: ribbon-helix-helix protein, CopG family [Thermoleophilia bacterium]|nr:ribbon-helix-helix protein, CopG family [Thermoleophilia bacterium]
MRRTQIYIDEDLDVRLRATAAAEGRSAAALIRDAVRLYLAGQRAGPAAGDPFLELAGMFEGGPRDASTDHDRYLHSGDEPGG